MGNLLKGGRRYRYIWNRAVALKSTASMPIGGRHDNAGGKLVVLLVFFGNAVMMISHENKEQEQ